MYSFFCRGDAFLESYIDGLARSQGPVVSGTEDEDQDGNLIRAEEKQFQSGEEFPDGREFKFNNLSQVSFLYLQNKHNLHNSIKPIIINPYTNVMAGNRLCRGVNKRVILCVVVNRMMCPRLNNSKTVK